MSRLSTNTHPLLTELVIEALNSKQIFTVNDFLKKKTDDIKKIAPALTPMVFCIHVFHVHNLINDNKWLFLEY